jgi:MinD-like ATPase involved in chromosome partitioning or flagellar assembly
LNPKEIERALDMQVEFEVESEREVPVSVNRGVPVALSNPRASMVKTLGEMADTLVPLPAKSGDGDKKARRGRRIGR